MSLRVYVQDMSFQWRGWLLFWTKVTITCTISTPIYCVIDCCVSPFLLNLLSVLTFTIQPQIVLKVIVQFKTEGNGQSEIVSHMD